MNPLARTDHGHSGGESLLPQAVAECARRIDYDLCRCPQLFAGLDIACKNSVHKTLRIFGEASDLNIVQQRRTLLKRCEHHVDEQASVVELPIVVNRSAP